MARNDRNLECGFSLVELLVALAFLGLLLAGMVRVFTASLASWNRVNESLTAQRALRWSLDRLAEDALMMGHLFPPPERRTLDLATGAEPGLQGAFMLVPGRPIPVARRGAFVPRAPGEDPLEPLGKTADELSFVLDLPVPARATLARAVPGLTVGAPAGTEADPAGAGTVRLRAARTVRLEPGDLAMIVDGRWECAAVAERAALPAGKPAELRVRHPDGPESPYAASAFVFPHAAGARVRFLRPLRVVRYAVVYLALAGAAGPDNPGGLVPCLVRWETGYPRDRTVPRWARLLCAPARGPDRWEVVAENVTGLRVDFSLDDRFPGIRGDDFAATAHNLETALRARLPGDGAVLDPLWFRSVGGLLQVTLETRSPVARDDGARPGEAPVRRFRYGRQTLLVRPRNFGLGGGA